MNNKDEVNKDLHTIRKLMEQSTRFLSLSGASGIWIGGMAILWVTMLWLSQADLLRESGFLTDWKLGSAPASDQLIMIFVLSGAVLIVLSMLVAIAFTLRRTKFIPGTLWSKPALRLWYSLMIPLVSGGLLCLILLYHRMTGLLIPCTLIFYGMALVNASKYTFSILHSLGILEILLGLLAALFLPYGLIFWILGFGVFHILYGIVLHFKYNRCD